MDCKSFPSPVGIADEIAYFSERIAFPFSCNRIFVNQLRVQDVSAYDFSGCRTAMRRYNTKLRLSFHTNPIILLF